MIQGERRWRRIAQAYEMAFQAMVDKGVADGMPTEWVTDADDMRWWMGSDLRVKADDAQIPFFGLRLDEADV